MKQSDCLHHQRHYFFRTLGIGLAIVLSCNMTSCGTKETKIKAENLMNGISSNSVSGKATDASFIGNTADFSIRLFRKTIDKKENSLISPVSVMIALSMTANGADKNTLSQMERVIGGDISMSSLNEYLYSYVRNLPDEKKSKLKTANSIWFKDAASGFKVKQEFLQKNADYYHAGIYKSAFDSQTLADINNWVNANTDGMITKILDQIDQDSVMYLLNTVVFDAEWKTVYHKEDLFKDTFTNISGEKQSVEFMISSESKYISDGKATGFIKPYYNDKYSFVALLPNEGISLPDYIASLSGDGFIKSIQNARTEAVHAVLPKFSYDYKILMNDALVDMGMSDAFSPGLADFSRLGESENKNIYIGRVLHKTFISVDELGTRAGAVTMVEMKETSALIAKEVILNRPFVYAIIDNATNLPIFLGTVTSLN